jgi:hypothetical protein
MNIIIEGARQIQPPNEIEADGLSVRYRGYAHRFSSGTGGSSFRVELKYVIEAEKPGTFTIPSVEFEADGKTVRTQAVTLTVQAAAAGGKAKEAGDNAIGFAEIVVPKNTAYLGETIPVELRLMVDSRVRWEPEQMPTIDGDGFTKTKIPNPRQEHARRDGKDYDVLVFRTAITPSKAGKITIGPSQVIYQAQVPRAQRNRPRSLFDDFFNDDVFSDPLFAQRQRVTAKAAAVEIDVKPLPTTGRPESFTGAVGQFKLTAKGTPQTVQIGDPVAMQVTISGRGNFDRVNAPQLLEPGGWHPYPAKDNWRADDELGMSGTKSFEIAIVPETKKIEMPRFEFSYFDPVAEQYVTLNSERTPLVVEGNAPPPPVAPAPSVASIPDPQAPPEPAAAPRPTDILGLRYDLGKSGTFEPTYRTRAFLAAQAVPATALLGLLLWRRFGKDEAARRAGTLRRRKLELWKKLRATRTSVDFYECAMRLLQVETALSSGRAEETVDAESIRASRELDAETRAAVEEVLHARSELVYAGTALSGESVDDGERTRVLVALERYERSHARP